MTDKRTVLVWIDLETTGLKREPDRILEYAVVLTDLELKELDTLTAVIPQNMGIVRMKMDDYVTEMHTKNGLLGELDAFPWESDAILYNDSIKVAEQHILDLMMSYDNEDVIFIIAGSTISFDRGFIEYVMPGLFEKLHYRQLDVSNYKVAFPDIFGTTTSAKHRAMDDIRDSIAVHAKMRDIVENSWKYEQLA